MGVSKLLTTSGNPDRQRLMVADYLSKRKNLLPSVRKSFDQDFVDAELPEDLIDLIKEKIELVSSIRVNIAADVGIVTIIPPELNMVKLALGIDQGVDPEIIGDDRYWTTTVPSSGSRRALRVILTMVGEQRNSECAAAVTRMCSRSTIEACILIGICGGVKQKVNLGDVIVASHVIDYEGARMEVSGRKKRPETFRPTRSARHDWMHSTAAGVQQTFSPSFLEGLSPSFIPEAFDNDSYEATIHSGGLASGEKLIVDGSMDVMRSELDQRIIGCDMESYGFAAACEAASGISWMIFRGVSDFGEPKAPDSDPVKKGDDWQHLASLTAATVGVNFLCENYRASSSDEF